MRRNILSELQPGRIVRWACEVLTTCESQTTDLVELMPKLKEVTISRNLVVLANSRVSPAVFTTAGMAMYTDLGQHQVSRTMRN